MSATFERSKIQLSTIFELSLYAMVGLSSVMLAFSEGMEHGPPPQTFTIVFLIVAFVVVDRWRAWFLPWWAAGALGIVGLVAAFWNIPQYISFVHGIPVLPEENRLDLIFAGAHLLVFLTWIVAFLEKTNQQYWWLWGLAVLQIAVGASQSTESLYGVLLSVYLFLAVWTLSVFSLLQGQQQFDRAQQTAKSTEPFGPVSAPPKDDLFPLSAVSTNSRWADLWRRPSSAIGNVQRDPSASWINLRFFGGVVGTASVAFLLALLFFFLVPRHPSIWRGGQAYEDAPTKSVVGFSRHLALGDMGQILESRKKVMEVRLTDFQTGEPLDIEKYAYDMGYEEPLFRGMTTNRYQEGRWRSWQSGDPFGRGELYLSGVSSASGELVKQQIRLQPIDDELLFAMPPARHGAMENSSDPISIESLSDILKRPEANDSGEAVSYTVLSSRSLETPGSLPVRTVQTRYLNFRLARYLQMPTNLENLRELALEKAGFSESPRPADLEMARRLESYLRHSGEFGYTLNASVTDRNIDPLEDFLFNRKVGHCEYFASALVLMLRSVDIPSRLVSGFKGGNYNPKTGLFEVEERHAHAWVEAYIDQHWVILDPTPAGRAESVASVGETSGNWEEFRGILRGFWSRFIVNLTVNEQRRLLEPLKLLVSDAAAWLGNVRVHFTNFVDGLRHQLRSPERWISWQGGLVTFVLLTFLSGLVWLTRTLWRLFSRLRSQYFDPLGLARTVAFYERFRRICESAGFKRKASQTPREFALEVGRQFREILPGSDGEEFPLSLIDAYYDVRYGGRQLSPETLHDLEQQLTRFETLLDSPRHPEGTPQAAPSATTA